MAKEKLNKAEKRIAKVWDIHVASLNKKVIVYSPNSVTFYKFLKELRKLKKEGYK